LSRIPEGLCRETWGPDLAGLWHPAAVNAVLAAQRPGDYAFGLLQMAADHAEQPNLRAAGLQRERLACGIDDPALDMFTAAAGRAAAAPT